MEHSDRSSSSDIVPTETLANLYLLQGHRSEALEIYRRLLEQDPDKPGLKNKWAELTRDAAPTVSDLPDEAEKPDTISPEISQKPLTKDTTIPCPAKIGPSPPEYPIPHRRRVTPGKSGRLSVMKAYLHNRLEAPMENKSVSSDARGDVQQERKNQMILRLKKMQEAARKRRQDIDAANIQ